MSDPIDRALFIARSGRPHCEPIAHLTATHNLPGTAHHVFATAVAGALDPDAAKLLAALRRYRDGEPDSPTYGCYQWYVEDQGICDTNASFFICTPLAALWLVQRETLPTAVLGELREVFAAVRPWFAHMAEAPSLFYPNKCLSDAAMLLATGHILDDPEVIAAGRDFCERYFDYYRRRGTGWGEDHSPVYTRVLLEQTLLILALEGDGPVAAGARQLTDAILDWAVFHDGFDAVPSIRGYNFEAKLEVAYGALELTAPAPEQPTDVLHTFQRAAGYVYEQPALEVPRQRQWRTFDEHYSTSYIGPRARLGTLSYYPLMPNGYMHDSWGLGWQTKPASFIVEQGEYGVLEWMTEDDEGVVRQHEANGSFHDFASRQLFKRVGFHPDVVLVGHQHQGQAIVLRELHQVHSPTRTVVDRWRLAHTAAKIRIGGQEWTGEATDLPADWLVLEYDECAVALRPLTCRGVAGADDDPNPQRRTAGHLFTPRLHLSRSDRGTLVGVKLVTGHEGLLTEPLLFSGWCVALLDAPTEVVNLTVAESFAEDGEVPRTYGELIRTVEFAGPAGTLTLVRDMLSGRVERRLDGRPVTFGA